MDNFLSGGITELQQAKAAIVKANKLGDALSESEKLLKSNDKDVTAQKKFMNDKIEDSIKSRRDELEKFHDDQISDAKKNLRATERDRKSAKSKAVNTRISGETNGMTEENRRLNYRVKTMFRQAKIPTFCNTSYYYALFCPKTITDFLIIALTIIICIAIIPNIVCFLLLKGMSTLVKIFVYAGIVVLFLALYLLVFAATKGNGKNEVYEQARSIRARIKANRKQIETVSDNIKNDADESTYGLEGYDTDIQRFTAVLQEKEEAKKRAMDEFDNYTAVSIRHEIESENVPVIDQLIADGKALKADFEQKQQAYQEASNNVTNTYTTYLGAKNATPDKIDDLIAIINEGKAATIMQALDVLNGEIK